MKNLKTIFINLKKLVNSIHSGLSKPFRISGNFVCYFMDTIQLRFSILTDLFYH